MNKEEIESYLAADKKIREIYTKVIKALRRNNMVKGTDQHLINYYVTTSKVEITYNYCIDNKGLGVDRITVPADVLINENISTYVKSISNVA